MAENETTNGKQETPASFKIDRSLGPLIGSAFGLIEIAEQIGSGKLAAIDAKEMVRALNGVPSQIKQQVEVIKMWEKGSDKAREQAARILDLGTTEVKALEKK
jgi:hypothetical protein